MSRGWEHFNVNSMPCHFISVLTPVPIPNPCHSYIRSNNDSNLTYINFECQNHQIPAYPLPYSPSMCRHSTKGSAKAIVERPSTFYVPLTRWEDRDSLAARCYQERELETGQREKGITKCAKEWTTNWTDDLQKGPRAECVCCWHSSKRKVVWKRSWITPVSPCCVCGVWASTPSKKNMPLSVNNHINLVYCNRSFPCSYSLQYSLP